MKLLDKGLTPHLAIALETVGCCVIAIALVFEYLWKAHIGFIGITGGALAIAVGSLIWTKIYKEKRGRRE